MSGRRGWRWTWRRGRSKGSRRSPASSSSRRSERRGCWPGGPERTARGAGRCPRPAGWRSSRATSPRRARSARRAWRSVARAATGTRYVREWLNAQAAGGYVDYDPAAGRYSLSPEQALLFAQEDSPAFFVGAFQTAAAAARSGPRLAEAFQTGEGISYQVQDADLLPGMERFFRPGFATNLVQSWIPALDGVEARLTPFNLAFDAKP